MEIPPALLERLPPDRREPLRDNYYYEEPSRGGDSFDQFEDISSSSGGYRQDFEDISSYSSSRKRQEDQRELRSAARREERRQGQAQVKFDQGLVIDYGARCAYQDGQPVHLAKKEFDIVELLSMHPSQVFDRERIYESVWGWDSEGDSSVVAEHIRRIRAKLTAAGCGDRIATVWGVGYKWQ